MIGSYSITVCDNYRISRSKIYQGEGFRGYIAGKKRYFYGLRIHMMVTELGEPVEFFLAPGVGSRREGRSWDGLQQTVSIDR